MFVRIKDPQPPKIPNLQFQTPKDWLVQLVPAWLERNVSLFFNYCQKWLYYVEQILPKEGENEIWSCHILLLEREILSHKLSTVDLHHDDGVGLA